MEYLKINGADFSSYVNELKITKQFNYNAQTNAAGNTVIDYINCKYIFSVGFIPMDETAMKALIKEINHFSITIFFLEPENNVIKQAKCYIPEYSTDYYTIQSGKILHNPFTLEFVEL